MYTEEQIKRAIHCYKKQKASAAKRTDVLGNQIQFNLTFEEWFDIWHTSGHYLERGRLKGQYVMSRLHDVGNYEIGNVEIKVVGDNIREGSQAYGRPPQPVVMPIDQTSHNMKISNGLKGYAANIKRLIVWVQSTY